MLCNFLSFILKINQLFLIIQNMQAKHLSKLWEIEKSDFCHS